MEFSTTAADTATETFALERALKWSGILVMSVLTLGIATGRSWNLNFFLAGQEFNASFFNAQAHSLLDGRLDVPYAGFNWTECFVIDGKCLGYFGVTPSLLRIPLVVIGGAGAPYLIPVSITLSVALTMWAVIDLVQRLIAQLIADPASRRLPTIASTIAVGLLLGPGSILTFLSRPRIYHEATLWMIAFLLVAMNLVYRWLVTRQSALLLLAIASAVLSANARPSSAPSALVLGLGVGVVLILDRRKKNVHLSDFALAGALAVSPILTAFGILWLKFGAFNIPWPKYNLYEIEGYRRLADMNAGQLQGLRFLPTNLINYLRPDSLSFSAASPFVSEQIPFVLPALTLWPIADGGTFVETFVSLTNAMTLQLLLTVSIAVLALMRRVSMTRTERQGFWILVVAGAMCPFVVLTSVALTTRYLGEFFPLMAIGSVFAIAHLMSWLRHRPRAILAVSTAIIAAALASFYIQLQLTSS